MWNKKIGKKAIIDFLAAVIFVGTLNGCGRDQQTAAKEDPKDPLTIESVSEGLYIMSDAGMFYSPDTEGQNFKTEVTSSDAGRIICSKNDTKYIPTLYADDCLVYFTYGEIPATFGVEKFCDSGYTCGLYGISKGSGGNYTFSGANMIGGSELSNVFGGYLQAGDVISILSVDDRDIADTDVTPAGTIRCEEPGQKLRISFMKGTFYNEIETVADEHIWYSEETSSIPSYDITKNGFIILQLPNTVADGDYISVMGTGLFQISKEKRLPD